jgi:hypothetical protein
MILFLSDSFECPCQPSIDPVLRLKTTANIVGQDIDELD